MVYVYYNLHKKVWSVRHTDTGLVGCHSDTVVLLNAEFKVSEAGRQRVLREQRKNVHAGVKGCLGGFDTCKFDLKNDLTEVTYNPYLYDNFVIKATGEKVVRAKLVVMHNKRVYAHGLELKQ